MNFIHTGKGWSGMWVRDQSNGTLSFVFTNYRGEDRLWCLYTEGITRFLQEAKASLSGTRTVFEDEVGGYYSLKIQMARRGKIQLTILVNDPEDCETFRCELSLPVAKWEDFLKEVEHFLSLHPAINISKDVQCL